MHTLIIVESPTKARAVAQYVRGLFETPVRVMACLGHLRDLPEGELHVEVTQGFRPIYAVRPDRQRLVPELRLAIQQAGRIILATDPDREGEAVAWHITQLFQTELKGKNVTRISYHAVTREAVQTALYRPRALDMPRVQAAIARRVMDRLFGYTLSPALWQGVKGHNLSAGRVQTAALRLLIEFEQAGESDTNASSIPPQATYIVEVEL